MRCQSISGLVRSGLTSTSFCTTAFEAKFSMSVTLGAVASPLRGRLHRTVPGQAIVDPRASHG